MPAYRKNRWLISLLIIGIGLTQMGGCPTEDNKNTTETVNPPKEFWSGTNDQGYPIYFEVSENEVVYFSYRIRPDGSVCTATETGSVQRGNDPISGNSFTITVTTSDAEALTFNGTFSETSCTGTWSASGGSCSYSDSGTWTAEQISDLPDDDTYEVNNSYSDASLISSGNYTNLKCYDDDWYKVNMESGKRLSVTISLDSSNVYMGVEILDADLSRLTYESGPSDNLTASYTTNSSGYYFIKGYRWCNMGGGDMIWKFL